jgi:hypothetical protein
MHTFLFCLLALAPAVSFADTLSPQEAHSILRQAQQASREEGSFKEVKTEKTQYGTATVTTYTLLRPDGARFSRTERVTTVDGHPERTQTSVSLTTADGNVQLFKHHALLFAPTFGRKKVPTEGPRQPPSNGNDGMPGVAEEPSQKEADSEFQDRLLTAAVRIAPHATISGERFVQDGWRRVRIVSSFDEEQNRVIETTTFNAAGKMLAKKRPEAAERIPDLSPEIFTIPAGLEVVRANGMFELFRLQLKIRKEERDAEKKLPVTPAGP